MDELFKNKYRISSIRLQDWDYSWPAMYYVTICTKDRACCLGEIKDGNVYLSEIGKIVFECWLEIKNHFDFVQLDDWIIMPNHLHGIIVFQDNDFGDANGREARSRVSTPRKFGPLQPKSLSSVVHAFKSAVKRQCNKKHLDFQWQAGFYEHIIRNEEDYCRIKEYIANNPAKWQENKNNLIDLNKK